MATLLKVDPAEWAEAVHGQEDFLQSFGKHLPREMVEEHADLARRVSDAMTPADLQGRDVGH
jgi:GTP-dependent phosphoenolpyruvate carboxykinase